MVQMTDSKNEPSSTTASTAAQVTWEDVTGAFAAADD